MARTSQGLHRDAAGDLAGITSSIGSSMAALNRQLEQLRVCSSSIAAHAQTCDSAERGTQTAETTSGSTQLPRAPRGDPGKPFAFHTPYKRINWRRVRSLNVERLAEEADAASAMELFEDVAYGDLDGESAFNLTEASALKLLRLAQLQLQVMQRRLEGAKGEQDCLEEGAASLRARLAAMPDLHLGREAELLAGLERGMRRLGDTQLDAMFEQVRGEERQAAKTALADAIQGAKRRFEAQQGGSGGGGGIPAGRDAGAGAEAACGDQRH